jgi:hypothetical protein
MVYSSGLLRSRGDSMQATIPQRDRAAFRRGSVLAAARARHAGATEPFVAPTPRCLGELRLVDLLRAGMINHAEFEAERAALLARL